MTRAIRTHLRDLIAVIVLVVIGLVVAGIILYNQRLTLPGWVPVLGQDFYELKGEFTTAQAVTPGQGQTVNIAGVSVGEIAKVELVDGRALVTMNIEEEYGEVYSDATMLLRPKTGLKDMVVELDPGTKARGERLASGATVPVGQTEPDVNLDEILSALDRDTRDYLQLLIQGGGRALDGQGRVLATTFKRFQPLSRDLAAITRLLAQRRQNIARSISNFSELSQALGNRDRQLSRFVDASNAAFRAFAERDQDLRRTIAGLPGALSSTDRALGKVDTLASTLGPTLQRLRPGARALGPSLAATRPFLRESEPIVREQLRPFAREALPTLRELTPAARGLAPATRELVPTFKVLRYAFNELAYNPPGEGVGREPFLFWATWVNHVGNTIFGNVDAHGSNRRGIVILECPVFESLELGTGLSDVAGVLIPLVNFPRKEETPCGGGAAAPAEGGE